MGNFGDQLGRFSKKAIDNSTKVFRLSAIYLGSDSDGTGSSGIIPDTPHDTGLAKNNWMTSLGAPSSATRAMEDPSGADALRQLAEVAGKAKLGDIIYLVNNLAYIRRLENGWSKRQAPNGMVGINVERFESLIKRIVAELDK